MSKKTANNEKYLSGGYVVRATRIIKIAAINIFSFRAYERSNKPNTYDSRIWFDGEFLGSIDTRPTGKKSKNYSFAIKKIHEAFPSIIGIGKNMGGYIEVFENELPGELGYLLE